MIVTQAELDAVLNPKIRRRLIHLPVRYGQFGERKRCPAKPGGVYELRAPVPYDFYRALASAQPTRARAVLRFIEYCQPIKGVTITVSAVGRDAINGEQVWAVRFERGDHASSLDTPVFLANYGDYTTIASRQAVPGDPEVLMPLAADLEKARAKAREHRISPEGAVLKREARAAETCQAVMKNMKARELVRRAQRNYEAAARLLLAEEDVSSRQRVAPDGSQGEEDRPHTATRAVASLKPEAA